MIVFMSARLSIEDLGFHRTATSEGSGYSKVLPS